jgi:hypothetical protein
MVLATIHHSTAKQFVDDPVATLLKLVQPEMPRFNYPMKDKGSKPPSGDDWGSDEVVSCSQHGNRRNIAINSSFDSRATENLTEEHVFPAFGGARRLDRLSRRGFGFAFFVCLSSLENLLTSVQDPENTRKRGSSNYLRKLLQ